MESSRDIGSLAEGFFELAQLLQGALAAALLLGGRAGGEERRALRRSWREGAEPHAADMEVLFEAIQLEEIG